MKRAMLAIACVLCVASVSDAQNIRLKPDGFGGYKIRGDYSGRLRSDGFGGFRGRVYNNYDGDSYYFRVRQPHMQYDPFNNSFYPSYGPKVGVYPWMYR